MKSIRTFLVAVMLAGVTLITFIGALHGYRTSMREAQKLFDMQLNEISLTVSRLTYDGHYPALSGISQAERLQPTYQVISDSGDLLLKSIDAPTVPLTELIDGFGFANFNGYRWRTLATHEPPQQRWIIVAERDDLRYSLGELLVMPSVMPALFALPLIGILAWVIVTLGLRPIAHLAAELRNKQANDLTPVDLQQVPSELINLAASANEMLRRLDDAFARERRFNSDVAHELRTPISALRLQLQNVLDDSTVQPDSARKLEAGMDRLSHLIEQMLLLNRLAPDIYAAQFSDVDLLEVCSAAVSDLLPLIENKAQSIEYSGGECIVHGDPFALGILVKNIISNAVKYTQTGGAIALHVSTDARGVVTLTVSDNGPGIPDQDMERVFERFYRVGGDRHRSGIVGCGLGLAISRHIAELHQAAISLSRTSPAGGLTVSITFAPHGTGVSPGNGGSSR
ncbi:MAG: sensor histidine kinase N-terminal domain-containing protein [Gammaproteobacteria bacterium]|nr:sensor histidine kinase N-terminal domain-containing protein [Gammaproteobacteria bacterium]